MKNIGIDFGTTNSSISYYDEGRKVLDSYVQAAGGSSYIPSCVAYRDKNGKEEISIGKEAKGRLLDSKYKVYQRFKLFLGEKSDKLQEYNYIDKYPEQVAKDYFHKLFEEYQKKQNTVVEQIVVTVPEIWIKEDRHRAAREKLKSIFHDLNLPLKKMISEPVAACAYFCHAYQQTNNKQYAGHVLVIDYGGGTLDLSLCEVGANKIKILESSGKGEHDNTVGRAGVAYDEETVCLVYSKNHEGNILPRHTTQFYRLVERFEDQKISMEASISENLRDYIKDSTLVEDEIFVIDDGADGIPVYCEDLYDVFDSVIKPDFEKSLNEVRAYFKTYNINENDQEKFCILLVGGFSNFFLVENAVREFFNSVIGEDDERFNNCFNNIDKSLAISKGAALVANGMVTITPTCPFSMGIRVLTPGADLGVYQYADIPVIKKGTKIEEIEEPKYIPGNISFSIGDFAKDKRPVIFLGEGENKRYFKLDKSAAQLFPNTDIPNNRWKIGFSIDEDMIIKMYAKDQYKGEEKETSLSELLDKFGGFIYIEDGEK